MSVDKLDPMRPLAEILTAPLSLSDLVDHLPPDDAVDESFITEMDQAWRDFLLSQPPHLLPQGTREARILQLQQTARDTEESCQSLQQELEQQAVLMQDRLEALETAASVRMHVALGRQEQVHVHQSNQLDAVALADTLQGQTLPWQHFFAQLEQAAAKEKAGAAAGAPGPSARALYLTTNPTVADPGAEQDDFKAHRMDHALLTTQVAMLKRELERSDHWMQSTEVAGKFLTEHNVWGLLKADSGTDYAKGGGAGDGADEQTTTTAATTLASRV